MRPQRAPSPRQEAPVSTKKYLIIQTLCWSVATLHAAVVAADEPAPVPVVAFQEGIEFNDPGRNYQVRLRFRSQNWAVFRTTDLDSADLASITTQPRRLRLRFNGWALSPQWFYSIQLGFSRADMDWDATGVPNVIRDAIAGYRFSPDLQVFFGQTKLPGNRQRVISSGDQQFADRSLANRDYTLDRDFGLQAYGTVRPAGMVVHLKLAISGGEGRNPVAGTSGLAYTARAELLPMGAFSNGGDYFEGDLLREPEPKLALGGGINLNRGALRTQGTLGVFFKDPRNLQTIFADGVFKWRGLAVSAEYLQRDCDDPVVKLVSDKTGYVVVGHAWNAQASYLWTDRLETALRATLSSPSDQVAAHVARAQQYGLGISYYLLRHRVKLQADVTQEVLTQPGKDRTGAWIARLNTEFGI